MPRPSLLRPRCVAITAADAPCKNSALPGKAHCRWHSPDPADVAKHLAESHRGGVAKAWGLMPIAAPVSESLDLAAVNLESAAGVRRLLAGVLRQLASLPIDARTANAISQVATAQRAAIETGDLEGRLAALEAQRGTLRAV